MASNRIEKDGFDQYLKETQGRERDYLLEVAKSRRNAWAVAVVALVVGAAGFGFGVYGNHRPTPAPVVLRVDNATGAVDVLSTLANAKTSYGQAVDQSNIERFVTLYESYNWATIQANYTAMGLFGSQQVVAAYEQIYNQQDGRQIKLKNTAYVQAHVSSIILNMPTHTATVRFTTQTFHENGSADPMKHWIASLSYEYLNAKMNPEQRNINPLGFRVTSYQVDPVIEP